MIFDLLHTNFVPRIMRKRNTKDFQLEIGSKTYFQIWSWSYQTFIFPVFRFLLISLRVCSIWKKCVYCTTAKLSSKKWKNSLFTKKKGLVGLPPGGEKRPCSSNKTTKTLMWHFVWKKLGEHLKTLKYWIGKTKRKRNRSHRKTGDTFAFFAQGVCMWERKKWKA